MTQSTKQRTTHRELWVLSLVNSTGLDIKPQKTPITCLNLSILICQAWICNLQWGCTDHNNCRTSGHWKKCYKVQKQHWVMLVVVVWAILENLAMTLIPATCYLAKSLNLWASRSSCEHMINNLCPASLRKWSELNENTGKHLQIAKHWYQFKVLWLNPSSLLNWNKTVT